MWSWAVLLIAMGLFIGIRHNFRSPAWFILMVVGGVVLIKSDEFARYFPGLNVNHIWPLALIILGLFFILRPHRRHRHWQDYVNDKVESKIDEPGLHMVNPVMSKPIRYLINLPRIF